jgi:hypothetical protein
VFEFIRFDDLLVKMALPGRELKAIAERSQRMKAEGAGLVFAGLDPGAMTINGRPIQSQEPYRVVVVDFLAEGGDGYARFRKGESVHRTGISLRSLITAGLKAWGTLSSDAFGELDRRGVWRSGWAVEGSFRRNYIDETTRVYRDQGESVSFLSGETSTAWNSATRSFIRYEGGPHGVQLENSADFGQISRTDGGFETSSDRLDADATYNYRFRGLKLEPVVSSGVSTAFTRTAGRRPFLWRASVGFQKRLWGNLNGRFSGRGQRDFVLDQSDYGAEIRLDFSERLRGGGRFKAELRSFFGFSKRKLISVENYNTFSFPLVGELSLTVRQNNYLYRVDKIRGAPATGVAVRTDLTLGFVYGLDWKWF